MLEVVVVVLKRAFGVVGRVDEDAFDLPAIKRQQRLQRLQVVALDQKIIGIYAVFSAIFASSRRIYCLRCY